MELERQKMVKGLLQKRWAPGTDHFKAWCFAPSLICHH